MSGSVEPAVIIFQIILVHFVLPVVLTLVFAAFFRKIKWIRSDDLRLQMIK